MTTNFRWSPEKRIVLKPELDNRKWMFKNLLKHGFHWSIGGTKAIFEVRKWRLCLCNIILVYTSKIKNRENTSCAIQFSRYQKNQNDDQTSESPNESSPRALNETPSDERVSCQSCQICGINQRRNDEIVWNQEWRNISKSFRRTMTRMDWH